MNTKQEYQKAIQLCDNHRFTEAKSILLKLISTEPKLSDYYRILGQIESVEGDQDQAINYLIEALRLDPTNGTALTMLGNIYGNFKSDLPTAIKYYEQALSHNSDDHVALTNLGSCYLKDLKWDEGARYVEAALKVNPDYANATNSMAIIEHRRGNYFEAFEYAVRSLRNREASSPTVYDSALSMAFKTADLCCQTEAGKQIFVDFKLKLEDTGGIPIEEREDASIGSAGKIEYSWLYNRDHHSIVYRKLIPSLYHSLIHELVHLEFTLEAREAHTNMLFLSNDACFTKFNEDFASTFKKVRQMGIDDEAIARYKNSLFQGMNNQMFNAPVDLFIEDLLFSRHPRLHPYQFRALYDFIAEGIRATSQEEAKGIIPQKVLDASIVLNLTHAMHFRDLYGCDLVPMLKAPQPLINKASKFYMQFLDMKDSRKAGSEFDLIAKWGKELGLDKYFELIDEELHFKIKSELEAVVYGKPRPDSESMDTFFARKFVPPVVNDPSLNSAIVSYMIEALEYLKGHSESEIKAVAHEIAIRGISGIKTDGETTYSLLWVPEKVFTGNDLLAWYYVTWAIAIPEMLDQLNLPYKNEYQMALSIFQ